VALLAIPRRSRMLLVAAGVAGLAVGWLPWLVEAVSTYGGVAERLSRASEIQGDLRPQLSVLTALRAVDGPILCRPCGGPIPVGGVVLWAGGLGAVAAALARARGRGELVRLLVPVSGAASLAVPYLFLVPYAAPRFLLPTYALLSLPVAYALLAGLASVRRRSPPLAVGAAAALAVAVLGLQAVPLWTAVELASRQRSAWAGLAATLQDAGLTGRCLVVGEQAAPIGVYAGCDSRALTGTEDRLQLEDLRRRPPVAVALVRTDSSPAPSWARGWRRLDVPTDYRNWTVYLRPAAGSATGGIERIGRTGGIGGTGGAGTSGTPVRSSASSQDLRFTPAP